MTSAACVVKRHPCAACRAPASGNQMSFADLGLSDELLRAVEDSGYTEPTPVQRQAIPSVLMNKDLIAIAQTGTGKTASFVLPMIDILSHGRARARMPRSLIMEPTRELAAQVAENFEKYGKNRKLSMALLTGGVGFGDQDKALENGVDVLIATPGRLMDQFGRGKILLSGVDILVRSAKHTSELQSLLRISYAVFCLKNQTTNESNKVITQEKEHK